MEKNWDLYSKFRHRYAWSNILADERTPINSQVKAGDVGRDAWTFHLACLHKQFFNCTNLQKF